MQIGLIGGIGPAATDFYYRRLISAFSRNNIPLELTIVHADTQTLLKNLARNDVESQVAIYVTLTDRLAAAGAGCVAITSIAGHFCIETFKSVSPLPLVDMISEVNTSIASRGFKRIGILGTRTVMETQFYGAITTATIIQPTDSDLEDVHQAYVAMAASGIVTPEQRAIFDSASRKLLLDYKVEAILLGGTDLALVYKEGETTFPLVDCAAIHSDAVLRFATS